jgi:hypothetical protein
VGSDRRHAGKRNLAVAANTYTHELVNEIERDYAELSCRKITLLGVYRNNYTDDAEIDYAADYKNVAENGVKGRRHQ